MDGCWQLLGDAQKTDPASAQEHSRPSNQVSERQPSASFTGASHPDSNPQLETDQSGQPFTGAHCQRAQPPACSVVSAIQSCCGTTPSPSTATVAEPMEQLSLQRHSSRRICHRLGPTPGLADRRHHHDRRNRDGRYDNARTGRHHSQRSGLPGPHSDEAPSVIYNSTVVNATGRDSSVGRAGD